MADKSPKPCSSNFPTFWYHWVHDDQYFSQPLQASGFYQTTALRHLTVFTNEIIKRYVNSENVFSLLNTLGNMGISYLFNSKRETETWPSFCHSGQVQMDRSYINNSCHDSCLWVSSSLSIPYFVQALY